jgi:predicted DsbA family dithiol-disulfide isomerase
MSQIRVDVWSDFNCPWCFLASVSLEQLQQTHGVNVVWHSYELRPKGSPPMPEAYRIKIETESRPRMEHMAKTVYGVQINSGKFGIDSRPALIGDKYAEEHGKGTEYHKATFSAYWTQAQDISDPNVLGDIAQSVGLDREGFLQALSNKSYEALVDTDILLAQQMDITGVPAILFQNKYLIPGAQPYDELVKALDYVKKRENIA